MQLGGIYQVLKVYKHNVLYFIKLVTGLDTYSGGHLISLPAGSSINYTLCWWGIQSLVNLSATQWGYICQSFSKPLGQSGSQSVRQSNQGRSYAICKHTTRINRLERLLVSRDRDTQLGAFHELLSLHTNNFAVFHKLVIALNSALTLEQFLFGISLPHGEQRQIRHWFISQINTALSNADMKTVSQLISRFVF